MNFGDYGLGQIPNNKLKIKLLIKKDLPILNLISISSENKSSIKNASDTIPNIYNYALYSINKYDEYINSS